MELRDIFIIAALFVGLRLFPNRKGRSYGLTVCAVLFVFWLQPALPIRGMDFWFPSASLTLTFCIFAAVRGQAELLKKENILTAVGIYFLLLLLSLSRGLSYDGILTASRPPLWTSVLGFIIVGCALTALSGRLSASMKSVWIAALLFFLIVLKFAPTSIKAAAFLRTINGQSAENAAVTDLRWLGFSYLAFRFLSVLLDARKGRKFDFNLAEFIVYACFPSMLSSGPIDRAERFVKDLRSAPASPLSEDLREALLRLSKGLAKKYLIADQLSIFSLSPVNAGQFLYSGWAWVSLCAYGSQLYFDFSACTDLALALGRILGLSLPENFDHPYLKPDLTKFWSCWHISLTQWIRSYVFNPLTRALRQKKTHPLPKPLIILICQLCTMLLIGLWHGIRLNFVIWGLWHGLGLFIHQQYAERMNPRLRTIQKNHPKAAQAYTVFSTLFSDFYVLLGWVWFALPEFSQAIAFFDVLF